MLSFFILLLSVQAVANAAGTCQINLPELFANWQCNTRTERAGCLTAAVATVGVGGSVYGRHKVGKDVDRSIEFRKSARAQIVQEIDNAMKEASVAAQELNKLAGQLPTDLQNLQIKYDFDKNYQAELQKLYAKDADYKLLKSVEALIQSDQNKRSQIIEKLDTATSRKGLEIQIQSLNESINSRQKHFDELSKTLNERHSSAAAKSVQQFMEHKELDRTDLFVKLDKAKSHVQLSRHRAEQLKKDLAKFDRVLPRYLKMLSQKTKVHAQNIFRWTGLLGAGAALAAWEVGYLAIGYAVETAADCTETKLEHPYICRAEKTCWENYNCDKVQNFMSLSYERQQELLSKDTAMCEYYSSLSSQLQLPAAKISYSCTKRELTVDYGIGEKSQKYLRVYSVPPMGIDRVEVMDEKSKITDEFVFDVDGKLTEFNSYSDSGMKHPASLVLYKDLQTPGVEGEGKSYKMRDLYVARNLIPLAQQCCNKSGPGSARSCEDLQSFTKPAGSVKAPSTESSRKQVR